MTSFFFPNAVQSGKSSTGSTTTSADGSIAVQLTSEWKRYWITWKTRSDVSGLKNVIIGRADAKRTGNVCIACPKFEKGNKPTDWTQAPEDVDKLLNKTMVSTVEEYYWSNSNIIPSGGEWSRDKDVSSIGLYLWKRNFVTRTDGTTYYEPNENGYCVSSLPKMTGNFEGNNVIINDSGHFTFPEFNIEGNHYQEIRNGYNKWSVPQTQTASGLTFTNHGDGSFSLTGTATATSSFSISVPITGFEFGSKYTLYTNQNIALRRQIAFYNGNTWVSTPINQIVTNTAKIVTANFPSVTATRYLCIIDFTSGTTYNFRNIKMMLFYLKVHKV